MPQTAEEKKIEERYWKMRSEAMTPELEEMIKKKTGKSVEDVSKGNSKKTEEQKRQEFLRMKYTTPEFVQAAMDKLKENGGDITKVKGYYDDSNDKPTDVTDPKDEDYTTDETTPAAPNPKKTPMWVIKEKLEKYTSSFVAVAFKIEAALLKFSQRNSGNKPVITMFEQLEINKNLRSYLHERIKDDFLYSSPQEKYLFRKQRVVAEELFEGSCNCKKVDFPTEKMLAIDKEKYEEIRRVFELRWRKARHWAWETNIEGYEECFTISGDDVRRKLHDPNLSKKDLNAILDCILNVDIKGRKLGAHTTKGQKSCDGGSGLAGQMNAKLNIENNEEASGAKRKVKKTKNLRLRNKQ